MVTSRTEDYLETIFEIEMEGQLPSITELASRLGLRKATVTVAVQRMTEENLMLHERYGKIALTRKGLGLALVTFRRHQQMKALFERMLDLPSDVAEKMACAVEHELTPLADQRVSAFVEFMAEERRKKSPWLDRLDEALKQPQKLTVPLAMIPPSLNCEVQAIAAPAERREELRRLGIVVGAGLVRCSDDEELCFSLIDGSDPIKLPLQDGVAIWVIHCATGEESLFHE